MEPRVRQAGGFSQRSALAIGTLPPARSGARPWQGLVADEHGFSSLFFSYLDPQPWRI
jgi:hypothetical protein